MISSTKPTPDHLADQRLPARAAIEQGVSGGAAIEAGIGERPLHHLDLVGALAEPAQLAIELGIELPHAGSPLLGQPHALQRLEPSHAQRMAAVVCLVGSGDGQHVVLSPCHQIAIEQREALLHHLAGQLGDALDLGLGAQLQRHQILRACADAVADVVTGHHQVLAAIVPAAHDDVGVGMTGVEVIDGDPI